MEENFSEFENQVVLTDKDIFTKIWTSPREVFKYINDNNYYKYVTFLLILSGIVTSFDRAVMKNTGDHSSLTKIIVMSVVFGGIFGWISYYMYAALISWSGKWLNGKGDMASILRMLSYSMLPSITALPFLFLQVAIYGIEVFKSEGDSIGDGIISNVFFYGSLLSESALGVWTIVLCVIGISEVQKLSIGKSILNLILPILFIVIPIVLILLITSFFD